MMQPDFMLKRITEITPEFLRENHIKGLILDIDNTLAIPDKHEMPQDIAKWLGHMKKMGFNMVILSNNSEERIKRFAARTGLPFVAKGRKPLRSGYQYAAALIKIPADRCAVVGDQLFTDIWGGNRSKMTTILTEPFEKDQTVFIRLKRICEIPLIRRYRKKLFKLGSAKGKSL